MDEPTGRVDDEWSLIGSQQPQMNADEWSVLQSDAGDLQLDATDWDDCRSEASSAIFSVTSAATARSSTATYGDHLLESDTAATTTTTAGLVPLASLPAGAFVARRNIVTDDGASEVSVTTRRGWPRVSRFGPTPRPPASVILGTAYRDALLREPPSAPAMDATHDLRSVTHPRSIPRPSAHGGCASYSMSAPIAVAPRQLSRRAHAGVVGGRVVLESPANRPGWTVLARPSRRPVALPLETLVEGQIGEEEVR